MINNPIRTVALTLSLLSCASGYSVPAKPGLISMSQPDGTQLNVKLIGDENFHYYLTEDGYLLAEDKGAFYYASTDLNGQIYRTDIQAAPVGMRSTEASKFLSRVDMNKVYTDLKALTDNDDRRSMAVSHNGPGLFEDTTFPLTGEQKGLVILVQYADLDFTIENPHDYFSRMVNEKGFSDYGGTGSARDYYLECSQGLFSPTFDVYGPITLPQNREFYGGNNSSGKDINPGQMVLDACTLLDDDIDFTQYDRDGDGVIDNVFIFYAGQGEASGGGAETVWPHSWTLEKALGYIPELDGLKLNRYACTNEWQKNRPDGVGTFVHEFSHVMGLPDLYATKYTGSFTPGAWSVMDYGPYNNDGCTPPLFSAFERYALGWLEPTEIKEPKSATLNSIGSNEAFIIKCGKDYEYYLLENRQQTSWDTYIPGHGMLIWHIDYVPSIWSANAVNNTPTHQYVDLEEADGTESDGSRGGDAFPGTEGITSFTDQTTPSMTSWTGLKLGLPITDITETEGVITFNVAGGRPEFPPVAVNPAKDITPESFTASWSATEHAHSYEITVSTKNADEETTVIIDHLNTGLSTEYTVTGLSASTTYYYYVNVVDFVGRCADSETMSATTADMTFEYMRPLAVEATDVEAGAFTAGWQALDEADNYMLNVYTKSALEAKSDLCDFTGGIEAIPEGWSTNVTATDSRASFSGESAPSLRMSSDGAYIQSAEYSADIVSMSFWHRGSNVPEANSIKVEALAGGVWHEAATIPVVNEAGGKTTDIAALPEGTRSVRIVFSRPEAKGNLVIDDIKVRWDMAYEKTPVDGFTDRLTGAVTSCRVEGLTQLTDYYYTVTAVAGERRSKVSNEIKVTTSDPAGIDMAETSLPKVTVAGRNIKVETSGTTAIKVFDLEGRMVGQGQGRCSVTVASPGIYIIKVGDFTAEKLLIK